MTRGVLEGAFANYGEDLLKGVTLSNQKMGFSVQLALAEFKGDERWDDEEILSVSVVGPSDERRRSRVRNVLRDLAVLNTGDGIIDESIEPEGAGASLSFLIRRPPSLSQFVASLLEAAGIEGSDELHVLVW